MDDELVLGRIDVRDAAMIDGEMQAVRRDRAVEQMVRRARMRIAEFAVGIAQRAHHVLLESRRRLQRRQGRRRSPGSMGVGERLGGGAGHGPGRRPWRPRT